MVKIITKKGNTVYYYYKKKRGRPKKRGPKKKHKLMPDRTINMKTWDFKVIICDNGRQTEYVNKYHDIKEISDFKKKIEQENEQVEFNKEFINKNGSLSEVNKEYVILKRIKEPDETNESFLRNEFGQLIKHVTTSSEWYIYDKIKLVEEETFWVYGFPPRDRKTFNWIYTNFIDNIIENSFEIIHMYLYNNKVIFRYDKNEINFIICKCVSDAIRMYNLLEEKYKKSKQIIFTGMVTGYSDRTNEIVNILHEKTGWNFKKLYRKTTSG